MAASDEFPRGLWQTSGYIVGGPTAQVTFPAIAGIGWVLAEIHAQFFTVAAVSLGVQVTVTGGRVLGQIVLQTDTTDPAALGAWDWSGELAYPLSTAVVVQFNTATTGNTAEILNVNAFPA